MKSEYDLEPYAPSPEAARMAAEALHSLESFLTNPPEQVTFAIEHPQIQNAHITVLGETLKLMINALTVLSRGEAVTLLPLNAELTTQEAANILRVSRPYLVKLLDKGAITSRKVGIYRRVLFNDLLEYQKKEKERQLEIMKELTKEAQEMGLYDLP